MFAIATPQTVALTIPGDDHPSTLINFLVNGEDTSRCVLEIVTPEGDTHRLTFSVRGQLVDSQFIDHDSAPEDPKQPPVNADAANRIEAGYKAVNVTPEQEAEHRDLRKQAERDAADRAKEALDKHLNRSEEKPQAEMTEDGFPPTVLRANRGLDTADNPKGDPNVNVQTFPNDDTQRLVGGKRMDGSPQSNPSGDPMAPAPSSPLPGSPPPHPLDQPDPGVVNTSKTLQGA